ncbi:hypothetical protein MTR67_026122 [Solanum verrucosum]|uniref:Reverse transcriptase/retrotransposon-derived protein RNase H-like domain-containing protein n=1 Tax=Solanum verrucosum TaxID=315347 RepID=A0AAF0TTN2_SOLVR|nr:hypothetical protein MTR67_026122 [Solanum verrucosum]
MVYCDASYYGLGVVLMHKKNVIVYASREAKEAMIHKEGILRIKRRLCVPHVGAFIQDSFIEAHSTSLSVPIPEGKNQVADEKKQSQITEWFREAKVDRPKLQTLRMLNAKGKGRWKRPKVGTPSRSASPTYFSKGDFVASFW